MRTDSTDDGAVVEVWQNLDAALIPGEPAWLWKAAHDAGIYAEGRAPTRDAAVSDVAEWDGETVENVAEIVQRVRHFEN